MDKPYIITKSNMRELSEVGETLVHGIWLRTQDYEEWDHIGVSGQMAMRIMEWARVRYGAPFWSDLNKLQQEFKALEYWNRTGLPAWPTVMYQITKTRKSTEEFFKNPKVIEIFGPLSDYV